MKSGTLRPCLGLGNRHEWAIKGSHGPHVAVKSQRRLPAQDNII